MLIERHRNFSRPLAVFERHSIAAPLEPPSGLRAVASDLSGDVAGLSSRDAPSDRPTAAPARHVKSLMPLLQRR